MFFRFLKIVCFVVLLLLLVGVVMVDFIVVLM